MHLLAAATISVDCPRAKAFAYAADLENFGEWFPGVIAIVARDQLAFTTIDKQYSEQVTVPLRGTREVGLRVVDVDEPRRIVTEGDLALLLPRMEMEFCDAAAGSCVIHWRMFSRVQSAWLSRSAIPLAGLLMRRRARVGLRTLKPRLEAHAQIP